MACIPSFASSYPTQCSGGTPSRSAAKMNRSGAGFPFLTSSVEMEVHHITRKKHIKSHHITRKILLQLLSSLKSKALHIITLSELAYMHIMYLAFILTLTHHHTQLSRTSQRCLPRQETYERVSVSLHSRRPWVGL